MPAWHPLEAHTMWPQLQIQANDPSEENKPKQQNSAPKAIEFGVVQP